MTIEQTSLMDEPEGDAYMRSLEKLVELYLKRLQLWTALPDERIDWSLERLMQDLEQACMTLRSVRNERSIPF